MKKRFLFLSVLQIFLGILLALFVLPLVKNHISLKRDLRSRTAVAAVFKAAEEISEDYAAGRIEEQEYFALLQKHSEEAGKEIDHKRVQKELMHFILALKSMLPYKAYKRILDETDNLNDSDKLYAYIIGFCRENNLDLSVKYAELDKFFTYYELEQKIKNNPDGTQKSNEKTGGQKSAA